MANSKTSENTGKVVALRTLVVLSISILFSEVVIMAWLRLLGLPPWLEILLDGLILTLVLYPVMVFFVYKPLLKSVFKCNIALQDLHQSSSFTESLLKTIPFGMDIIDEEGNVMYMNDKLKSIFGEGAIGKKCWELYRDDKAQCGLCPLKEKFELGKTDSVDVEGVFGGRSAHVTHIRMMFHGKRALMEIFVDTTEKRRLEKMKDEFVSTVSHELRTPLSITREGVSLIIDRITGPVNDKQEQILKTSLDNIDRLARIINDLLDMSRIEAGMVPMNRSSLDLVELIKKAAGPFKPGAGNKGVELKLALPDGRVEAQADSDRITQVLSNLIDNAIKFTSAGYVEVSLKDGEKEVICSVRDTGPGIQPENLPLLFEKFQQFGRVPGPGKKGTGLGLSISKGIIELHGGRIWADSQPGKGTMISFALPKKA